MISRRQTGLALGLFALGLISSASGQAPKPQDAATLDAESLRAARQAFGAVSARLKKVVELHAVYLQEQESLLLAEPLVSKGHFHLRFDPGCLVLRLDEPSPAVIRSDATSHRVFDPAAGRAEVFLFDENRLTKALIACFRADLEQVESIFRIVSYRESSRERQGQADQRLATVELLPKTDELKGVMRSLTLAIDLDAKLPVRVTQINREGEAVAFQLLQPDLLEKPAKDSATIFGAELPKGTKVVERRVDADR